MSSSMPAAPESLTTTSYAILSLLAVRSWTTYQLAKQMERSVGAMWPRATSVVYEEPKRLVAEGLAESRVEHTGKRASTVYSITEAGRAALAAWLEVPGDAPSHEFEALLKVAFADHGSIEGLRANLAEIRRQAQHELDYAGQRATEYAETGGPHPDRLPVIALAERYFHHRAHAVLAWAEWAEAAVADWTGVTPDTGAEVPPDAFRVD